MTPQTLTDLLKQAFPNSAIQVQDLTGGGDHYQVMLVSEAFRGLSLIKQHQQVYAALQAHLDSGAIHALALKTYSPEQWQQNQVTFQP
ncbi:MAG: BolA family transcriptional regulator [Synechococcaceae cyanobacterium SM2_3_60]|nr:BolA family transcriptional regulator [Synechococcaceae cyanobacterium SM2_3_60]